MMAKPCAVFFRSIALLIFLMGALSPSAAGAIESKTERSSDDPTATPAFDKERERNVLQMVDDHLPEIKSLLDQLRKKEPHQYELAIQNLAKSSRRLQAAQKRGNESFALEVQIVQAQSSINLLIAKLKVRDNKQDREALREATQRFETAEVARAEYEVNQLQLRIKKMQEQLESAEQRLTEKQSKMDEDVEKGFQSFLRKSGRK